MASNIRELSDNSKSSVGNAKESDGEIRNAIENVNNVILNIDDTVKKLIPVTNGAIEGVQTTSSNSQRIKESMEDLERLAKEVEDMIIETNKILKVE